MKKIIYLTVLIVISIVGIAIFYKKREDPYVAKLLFLARECIRYNDSIVNKEQLYELIDQLAAHKHIVERDGDRLRVKYVLFQGCMEHVLACSQALNETLNLIGIIHTPMPATPLCTKPDEIDLSLLDASIRTDPDKLLTVRSRANIVREYLEKGGTLFIVYPQGGLDKRSSTQKKVYLDELNHYPEQLVDWVLTTNEIPSEMVGATYVFKNTRKEVYIFSIQAKQANDPKEDVEWGLWFGKVTNGAIQKRLTDLFTYFESCGGPSRKELNV